MINNMESNPLEIMQEAQVADKKNHEHENEIEDVGRARLYSLKEKFNNGKERASLVWNEFMKKAENGRNWLVDKAVLLLASDVAAKKSFEFSKEVMKGGSQEIIESLKKEAKENFYSLKDFGTFTKDKAVGLFGGAKERIELINENTVNQAHSTIETISKNATSVYGKCLEKFENLKDEIENVRFVKRFENMIAKEENLIKNKQDLNKERKSKGKQFGLLSKRLKELKEEELALVPLTWLAKDLEKVRQERKEKGNEFYLISRELISLKKADLVISEEIKKLRNQIQESYFSESMVENQTKELKNDEDHDLSDQDEMPLAA